MTEQSPPPSGSNGHNPNAKRLSLDETDVTRKTHEHMSSRRPKLPDSVTDDLDEDKKDTAILSQSSPLLRRALSQQTMGGTASLDGRREVILVIRGIIERIFMEEGRKYLLGRFDSPNRAIEEIDLIPYGAMDKGVSRVHAEIYLEGDFLYITDLDSTNGTFLGGVRLTPKTPTLLRKGTELLIGRLPVQILFR